MRRIVPFAGLMAMAAGCADVGRADAVAQFVAGTRRSAPVAARLPAPAPVSTADDAFPGRTPAWTERLARLVRADEESAAGTEGASKPKPDKSGYNLFHPTPRDQMRELSPDRPDKTDSPITVDAGHIQIETDIFTYAFDRRQPGGNGTDDHAFAWVPAEFKVGLLNNADFQVILRPFNLAVLRDRESGSSDRRFDFGDTTARLKVNLWGNDGGEGFFGKTALAVSPFVTAPTGVSGASAAAGTFGTTAGLGGGVAIPFAAHLGDWNLGAMVEFDGFRNRDSAGSHAEFSHSVVLGRKLGKKLEVSVELFGNVSTEAGERRWAATVDFGIAYKLTKDLQLDGGLNIGVTRAAPDFNPYVGFTTRF